MHGVRGIARDSSKLMEEPNKLALDGHTLLLPSTGGRLRADGRLQAWLLKRRLNDD
jgi:hypothetical protein